MLTVNLTIPEVVNEVLETMTPLDQDLLSFMMEKQPLLRDIRKKYNVSNTPALQKIALSRFKLKLEERGVKSMADLQ